MKKKIYGAIAIAAVAVVITFTVNVNTNANEYYSSISLSTIEALANDEGGTNYNICYSESRVRTGYTYYDCQECTKVYDEKGKGSQSKCFY